ncbi:DUF624 domain-containing protein [Actinotalea sp. K2]|uniref:DUF624 domain-containing protein n=1 Tax=Actinotalea sp. K2 TaxID=2939438 RepID=UPI0020177980|nr:DUF624 domain-containing protein [Actinotalea sp. K2]MCL3859518.1 DUF624 domain-containing protein [Actinotalea sp. K2]
MSTSRQEFGAGPLPRVANVVMWFLVVEGLLVLTLAPGLALALVLTPDATNLPLFALAALPVGPALAAAFFTWRRFHEERDTSPAQHFARGYRINLGDSLRVWVPAVVVLLVLTMNLASQDATGIGRPVAVLYAVMSVVVLVLALRMLAITATFAFRWRDVARITVLSLGARPLPTLGLLSYVVLVVGLTVVTFDAVVVMLASLLTYGVLRNELSVLGMVRRRFVAP